MQAPIRYLDYSIDPNIEGVHRICALSFENTTDRKLHNKYYLPNVELKDCNAMNDDPNFFYISQ